VPLPLTIEGEVDVKKRPLFMYTEGLFYKIWISVCILILITAIANSVGVYIQISRQLNNTIRQRLQWEAHFYRQQLDQIFIRADEKLNSLANSSAALSANRPLLQKEMETIHHLSPSIIRSWVAYPNGLLISSSHTRPDYVRQLPWWREYLSGIIPRVFHGLWVGRGQSLVGKPLRDQSGITTLVPLFSLKLRGVQIVRAVGAQLDLNSALIDDSDINSNWGDIHVSIYTLDGVLMACPYRYLRGNFKLFSQPSHHPLILQMLARPNEISGFQFYAAEGQKNVGMYLRDPYLGLVLTVEYPATEVLDPISRITIGPLIVTALLLLITSIVLSIIYSNTKRLHRMEQLARSAELRALQAHINPHFLFNTLDRMVGMAAIAENLPLLKMLKSLADILRYTTRKMGELVTLNEELTYLQEYIALQQIRFGSRLSFQLDVAPVALNYKIFKLSIQPLVENCFTHGVEKSLDPVTITLKVIKKKNCLEIRVFNNGPAITAKQLQAINNNLEQETYDAAQNHGLGLSNIHHRYQYAYGKPYGIRLEPEEHGLTVILVIPLLSA
jgi:hypothetical protein